MSRVTWSSQMTPEQAAAIAWGVPAYLAERRADTANFPDTAKGYKDFPMENVPAYVAAMRASDNRHEALFRRWADSARWEDGVLTATFEWPDEGWSRDEMGQYFFDVIRAVPLDWMTVSRKLILAGDLEGSDALMDEAREVLNVIQESLLTLESPS